MEARDPGKTGGSPPPKPGAAGRGPSDEVARRRRLVRWGVIGAAVLIAVVVWLIVRGDDGGESEPAAAGFEARIVDETELEETADAAGHPVYWAGPMAGKVLVVNENEEGNVQVRYMDESSKVGGSITIGSYPVADPEKELDGYAEREGAIVEEAPDGRKLVSSTEAPASVYFVSPDNTVQVEVYAPTAKRALSLARSGRVQPVG